VERGCVTARKAPQQSRCDRRVLLFWCTLKGGYRRGHAVGFEVQLRRDVGTNAPSPPEPVELEVVLSALIVEVCVLPEAAYQ
jgi:hypothetical protein